jgi:hypothetical protein
MATTNAIYTVRDGDCFARKISELSYVVSS